MRISLVLAGVGTLGSLLVGGVGAGAATGPATPGGVIHVDVVSYNGSPDHDVITGAFADAGFERPVSNTVNRLILSRGTFEVTLTSLGNKINNAYNHLSLAANCSGFIRVSGTVTLGDGTAAYAGISGTVSATYTTVFVLPRKANGQCNESNSAQPIGQVVNVVGSGTVAFK